MELIGVANMGKKFIVVVNKEIDFLLLIWKLNFSVVDKEFALDLL
jgi:hypothetical protein